MNKQTFQIPDGCKAVTVEQVGNQIITTFEPEFKRGDVLINDDKDIFVLDKIDGDYAYEIVGFFKSRLLTFGNDEFFAFIHRCRHATTEEAQRLWDALAKEGKRWNPETMEVEEIEKKLWRAEIGVIDIETAAPELLEACINSFKTLIAIGCTMEAEIMQQLEAAIKKATE